MLKIYSIMIAYTQTVVKARLEKVWSGYVVIKNKTIFQKEYVEAASCAGNFDD